MSMTNKLCPAPDAPLPPLHEWMAALRQAGRGGQEQNTLHKALWERAVCDAQLADYLIAAGLFHLFYPERGDLSWLFSLPRETRGSHYEALRSTHIERAELLLILSAGLERDLKLRFLVKLLMNRSHSLNAWLRDKLGAEAATRAQDRILDAIVSPALLTLIERPTQSEWLLEQLLADEEQLPSRIDVLWSALPTEVERAEGDSEQSRCWAPLRTWLARIIQEQPELVELLSQESRLRIDRLRGSSCSQSLNAALRWTYEQTTHEMEPSLPAQVAFWSNYQSQLQGMRFFFDEGADAQQVSAYVERPLASASVHACAGLSRRAPLCLLEFRELALVLNLSRSAYIQHLPLESPIYQELSRFEGGSFSSLRDSLGLLSRYPQDEGWQVLLTMLFEERSLAPDHPERSFLLGPGESERYQVGKGLVFDPDVVMARDSSLRRYLTRHIGQSGGE